MTVRGPTRRPIGHGGRPEIRSPSGTGQGPAQVRSGSSPGPVRVRSGERSGERPGNRSKDRAGGRSGGQPGDRSANRRGARFGGQLGGRPAARPGGRLRGRPAARPGGRLRGRFRVHGPGTVYNGMPFGVLSGPRRFRVLGALWGTLKGYLLLRRRQNQFWLGCTAPGTAHNGTPFRVLRDLTGLGCTAAVPRTRVCSLGF